MDRVLLWVLESLTYALLLIKGAWHINKDMMKKEGSMGG